MKRSHLRVVFDECSKRGILTSLNESCCDTCNTCALNLELEKHPECFGYVYSHAQTVDRVMEELLEEGSSTIFFGFDGRTEKDLKKTGYALASILKKHGYIVDWNENMTRKIAVVIEESDLPPGFKEKWLKTHQAYLDAYPDESKDDHPVIAAFMQASRKMYFNNFEEKVDVREEEETKEIKIEDEKEEVEESNKESKEESEQEETNIEDIINEEQDGESDCEDVEGDDEGDDEHEGDYEGDDEEGNDEHEGDDEGDLSSIPAASDIEDEGEDSIPECESDCECVNCIAERDEE